jgi:hypothetical protein
MDSPPGGTAAGVATVAASTRGQPSPEQQQEQVTPDLLQHAAAAAAAAEAAAAAGEAQTGARAAPSCRVPGCTVPLLQTYNQVCLQPSRLSSRGYGVCCRCLASPALPCPPGCLHDGPPAWMPACVFACMPVYVPASLACCPLPPPACRPACPPARLPVASSHLPYSLQGTQLQHARRRVALLPAGAHPLQRK